MIAIGELLMNGSKVYWPPRDVDGTPVHIGDRVYGMRDTYNLQDEHAFTVGGLRLQNQGGELAWVICAYDDADRYFECYDVDCKVLGKISIDISEISPCNNTKPTL